MLRPSVQIPDLAKVVDSELGNIADLASLSMREAALGVKQGWREEIIAGGLGNRMANTVRANTYPKSGGSINPAAYIYSRAPKIMDAFSRGATIRPVNGARYLWIPTANVPRKMGRGRGKMSPEEVELHFNAEFVILPGKGGELLAFLPVIGAKSGRGHRRATKGRLAQGRQAQDVLMFTLVRTVRMPKKIDLEKLANDGAADFVRSFTARIGR